MCVMTFSQDAVALRKVMSVRKYEIEQATKSGTQATPLPRLQRVRTRCSAAGTTVSGQSLVAEIATLPDESDDEEQKVAEPRDDADSELATV